MAGLRAQTPIGLRPKMPLSLRVLFFRTPCGWRFAPRPAIHGGVLMAGRIHHQRTLMETWPPPPTNRPPQPDTKYLQAQKNRAGLIAFACSGTFVLIRLAILFGVRNIPLSVVSLLLFITGIVLGIISRTTLLGRLAFLGPGFLLTLMVLAMLRWYHILG